MMFSDPSTFRTGKGLGTGRNVRLFFFAKCKLIMIPSALLSRSAYASLFLPVIFPMNSTCNIIDGICLFWVIVDILSSDGNMCSHGEDKTKNRLLQSPV